MHTVNDPATRAAHVTLPRLGLLLLVASFAGLTTYVVLAASLAALAEGLRHER